MSDTSKVQHLEAENETLKGKLKYYKDTNRALENELSSIKVQLAHSKQEEQGSTTT